MNRKAQVLIFIVSYNAELFIQNVLQRIPESVWNHEAFDVEVLVIDDQSQDRTFERASDFIAVYPERKIKILYNPKNQGYGGNQKLGYHYSIQHNFDVVVLLHGDGQYAPEHLESMILPIINAQADVVLGSRMVKPIHALHGKMPFYKWIGNQVLTHIQNSILGSSLSEFHTGYRAYRINSLRKVPFEFNSNYFDFDTDILIQMIDTRQRIHEVEIPTYYGDEICYVNGIRYAVMILLTTIRSRISKLNLLYDRRFDYQTDSNQHYTLKTDFPSSHSYALSRIKSGMMVLDIGSGPGYMARELFEHGIQVISLDRKITELTERYSTSTICSEIESYDFGSCQQMPDIIFMLDIIEHTTNPERVLLKIRDQFGIENQPEIVMTTGNIGFFIVRLGLFFGLFNYGKKGILDQDHKRLYTFRSLRRLLESTGYEILEVKGIPAPFPEAVHNAFIARILITINQFLIQLSKGLFAYQIAFLVRPKPTIRHLLALAQSAGHDKSSEKLNLRSQGSPLYRV